MEWKQISETNSLDDLQELKTLLFKESVRLENEKREILEIREKFLKERVQFRDEMNTLNHKMVIERKRMKEESSFFDKKLQILQDGFRQLDLDRRIFEKEKERFDYEKKYKKEESIEHTISLDKVNSSIFFKGVNNPMALRKRYRDLMKIFHPDNLCGDAEAVQCINKEFERLKDK